MIVPGVILDAESRYVVELAAFGEVLIDECRILDEEADVGVEYGTAALRRRRELGRLRLHCLEAFRQLLLGDLVRLGFFRQTLHALHQRLNADLLLAHDARR